MLFNVTTIRLIRAYERKLIKIDLTKCLHNINIEMDGLQHGRLVPQTRMHPQFTFPI